MKDTSNHIYEQLIRGKSKLNHPFGSDRAPLYSSLLVCLAAARIAHIVSWHRARPSGRLSSLNSVSAITHLLVIKDT
jgi:hypothetical protein